MPDFHRTFVNDDSFIRGAARLLWAGSTVTFPTKLGDVINLSTYDAITNWNELGATKNGVQISINNTEEEFDVDQVLSALRTLPTNWECSVSTNLAEASLERLQIVWEGSDITTDVVPQPDEREMGFGVADAYIERRLAVLFARPNGKIRGYLFRRVNRSPQESTINYAKSGEQQTVPVRFKALADTSITDIKKRFFIIRDQI